MKSFAEQIHERALHYSKLMKDSEIKIISLLQEIDEKKVFRALGYASLFQYTTEALGHSEAVAYNLISIARKSREVPELKTSIEAGKITLSNARKILPVLVHENKEEWLAKAEVLSKRNLEKEIAKEKPEAVKPDRSKFINEKFIRLEMNLSEEVFEKLKHVQELIRKKNANTADYEETFVEVLNLYIEKKDPVEKAKRWEAKLRAGKKPSFPQKKTSQGPFSVGHGGSIKIQTCPGTGSRKRRPLQANTRHKLNLRDGAKCQICHSKKWTEIHHIHPVRAGGSNRVENLITLCWQHHQMTHLNPQIQSLKSKNTAT